MYKSQFIKNKRLTEYFLYLRKIRRKNTDRKISKIGVLVSINPESRKFWIWHDGFTEAVEKLKNDFSTSMIFFDTYKPKELVDEINAHDFIIVKSSWRTTMDYFLRKHHKSIHPYLGLMISGSNHVSTASEQDFYHVVWYETEWYKKRMIRHKNAFHTFGIDTKIMHPPDGKPEKQYDFITVGAPKKYKRLERLLDKKGKRLLIGDLKNSDALIQRLEKDGVVVEDFQDYHTLSKKYHQSKVCYIPCRLHGGGDRSLLEA